MRLIDADALINDLRADIDVYRGRGDRLYVDGVIHGLNVAIRDVREDAPTIDPVRHAHWIEDEDGDGRHCSGCGHDYCYMLGDPEIFEFCPFCGAKMDA